MLHISLLVVVGAVVRERGAQTMAAVVAVAVIGRDRLRLHRVPFQLWWGQVVMVVPLQP